MEGICDYCGNVLIDEDFITECGHIICGTKCYSNDSICPICKKKCKFVKIGEKVPEDAIGFLKPIKNIFEDTTNIINFRLFALQNLVKCQRAKIAKQKDLINQAKQELKLVKEYKWEIYHLKKENEKLKSKLNRSKKAQSPES